MSPVHRNAGSDSLNPTVENTITRNGPSERANFGKKGKGNVMGVHTLRRLLRHDYFGTIPRVNYWLWLAYRQHRLLASLRATLGYPHYRSSKPLGKLRQRRGNTFFIIGSGDSVNDLSPEQFAAMDNGTSVGLNVWVAHEYVPDYYSFEGGDFPASKDELIHRRFLSARMLLQSGSAKQPAVLQLVPKAPHHETQMVSLPQGVRRRSALVGRVNLVRSLSLRGLRRDLRVILFLIQLRVIPLDVFPDSGASVVRMVFHGFQQGFKDIVLVGVDLNATSYFWYRQGQGNNFGDLRRLFPRPVNEPHDTLRADNRPFGAREFILTLAAVLKQNYGVNVWAGSPRSSLAGKLGVYDWNATEGPVNGFPRVERSPQVRW